MHVMIVPNKKFQNIAHRKSKITVSLQLYNT